MNTKILYYQIVWETYKESTGFPEEAELLSFKDFAMEHDSYQLESGDCYLYCDDESNTDLLTLDQVFDRYLEVHKCFRTFNKWVLKRFKLVDPRK